MAIVTLSEECEWKDSNAVPPFDSQLVRNVKHAFTKASAMGWDPLIFQLCYGILGKKEIHGRWMIMPTWSQSMLPMAYHTTHGNPGSHYHHTIQWSPTNNWCTPGYRSPSFCHSEKIGHPSLTKPSKKERSSNHDKDRQWKVLVKSHTYEKRIFVHEVLSKQVISFFHNHTRSSRYGLVITAEHVLIGID